MEITKKQKTVSVYKVGDREFLTEADARAHLEQLHIRLGFTYYPVDYGFDMTEGRGFYSHTIVAVQHNEYGGHSINSVYQHLFGRFGGAIDDFYGRPVGTWAVRDPQKFDDVTALDDWLRSIKADSTRYFGHRFEDIAYIDGFGALLPSPV